MSNQEMTIATKVNQIRARSEQWFTIHVGHRVDALSFSDFYRVCEQAIDSGKCNMVLDFQSTQFVSMRGFQYIHELYLKLIEDKGDLLLVSTSEKLKKQALIYCHKDIKSLFRSRAELTFL